MASTDERLFSERDEWKDVQPVEQYETVNPLAPIFYTAEYSDATGYLRAIVQSGEKSLRVLELTENVIRQNPAHYSAWQYRYETLLALLPATTDPLPPLLESELALLDTLSIDFLKTYQVWHHRRLLLLLTHRVSHELDFIKRGLLNVDNKNYHTWSYRQWILAHFCTPDDDLWAAELDFVDTMLVQDLRNNSAWHHRFFVVWARGVLNGDDVKRREIIYTKQNISLAPSNPSAWNYLRGVLTHTKTPFSELVPFALMYTRPAVHPTVIDLDNPGPGESAQLPCVYALEFVADAWEAQARELISEKNQAAEELIQKAVTMWEALGTEWDVVRKKYWEYRIREAHLALG